MYRCCRALVVRFFLLAILVWPSGMAWSGTEEHRQQGDVHGTRVVDLDGHVHRIGTDAGIRPVVLLSLTPSARYRAATLPNSTTLPCLPMPTAPRSTGSCRDPI